MSALLSLGLLLAGATSSQGEAPREVEVFSPSGRFVAQIRKAAGQERVAEALARWRLTVQAIDRDGARSDAWSCVIQHPPGQRSYVLGDDGLAFASVDPAYEGKRTLVRVWRAERELAALDARALDLGRVDGAWLAPEHAVSVGWIDSPTGPAAQLFLELAKDGVRRVDLATGETFSSREWIDEPVFAPLIDDKLRATASAPFVKSVNGPSKAYWGEPIEIKVEGTQPSPSWRSVGFDVRIDEQTHVVIAPLSGPPPRNSVQATALDRYATTATLAGLHPGHYEIRVVGRGDAQPEPLTLDVLPARPLCELRIQGGFLGLDDTIRVFASGVAVATSSRGSKEPRYIVLDAQDRRLFDAAFGALPLAPTNTSSRGADMFAYTLRWTREGKELEWRFDDGSADSAGRELVRVLRDAVTRASK